MLDTGLDPSFHHTCWIQASAPHSTIHAGYRPQPLIPPYMLDTGLDPSFRHTCWIQGSTPHSTIHAAYRAQSHISPCARDQLFKFKPHVFEILFLISNPIDTTPVICMRIMQADLCSLILVSYTCRHIYMFATFRVTASYLESQNRTLLSLPQETRPQMQTALLKGTL